MTPLPVRFADHPLLWTVEAALSPAECAAWIEYIERAGPRSAGYSEDYRDQDRLMVDDEVTAALLFDRLRDALPAALGPFRLVGLNPRLRFYRYRPGQHFAPHTDHWYRPSPTQITLLTVLVYFNDDFTGGETVFTEQVERVIRPAPGLAAIFQHKIRHAGNPVLTGRKYAVRSDVIYEADEPIGFVDA